jgi:hypothetical protein
MLLSVELDGVSWANVGLVKKAVAVRRSMARALIVNSPVSAGSALGV